MDIRGVVGIGTLIIFIAMILVASTAAGVIIRISGSLQAQARATGREAIQQVSTGIRILSAVGRVSTDYENIDNIEFIAKLWVGSPPIDLTEMTISYLSETTQIYLTIGKYDNTLMVFENLEALENHWNDLDANEFAIVKIQNISGTDPGILGKGDVVGIWINVQKIEEPQALQSQDSAVLTFVPEIGFETRIRVSVPTLIPGDKVVSLY